jgi:two-component system, LytTR family, response regulator
MKDTRQTAKKIRTVIVDDEPLARTNLMVLLRTHPEIEIIAECGSGREAVSVIRMSNPDLVFLDVQMPESDGFDVVEMLGRATPCIVFVTAYDSYALRAFEVGALDYLLKPFDKARFERTLERAKERVASADGRQQGKHSFIVKTAGQISFVAASEIDWIEAADYYVSLHVGPRTHLLRRSMLELEQMLDRNAFCRIHRSAIVRLDRVRCLGLNESGEYDVLLDSGKKLRLSRRYRKELQFRLGIRDGRVPRGKSSADRGLEDS